MISYDTYQNKIKRVAAVKNFIVRFRALFIALFAVLIALILAFIFTKGMITQDIVLPDKIVYGDDYAAGIQAPKALFSNVEYQFKRVKEEKSVKSGVKYAVNDVNGEDEYDWTYECPTLAGKYLVRTVSNKTFGKSYGEPKEFSIEAYSTEFIIESDSVVYGEMPENYTFNLINGDKLVADGLKFDYENPAENVTDICANAESFRILNKSGEDVTFCYDINVPQKESVTILPKDITLTPEPLVTEYDGTETDYNSMAEKTVINLKGGTAHIRTRIYDGAGNLLNANPVNAGIYTVEVIPEETTIFNGEADVLKHYNISYSTTTITINRRPVTVTTESGNKEYDGTPLIKEKVEEKGLVSGQSAFAVFNETRINAGTYTNSCEYAILDTNGVDLTANYDIEYVFGNLEITPRKIKVATENRTKTYDGAYFSERNFNGYTVEKEDGVPLVSGHTYGLRSAIGITNVGESGRKNEIAIEITDGSGNDVSYNYEIEYVFGTLVITPREISVTSASGSWIYDGTAHSSAEIAGVSLIGGEGNPVAEGEEIIVTQSTEVTFFTEDPVKNEIVCSVTKDGYDTTANYKINYIEGTLTIEKRPLTITTLSVSKPYDGYYLYGTAENSQADNLAVDDFLRVKKKTSLLHVGAVENVIEFQIGGYIPGDAAGLYDKTLNYEITYNYGMLEITKRNITVTTPSLNKIYDGKELKGDSEEPVVDNIVDGEVLVAYEPTTLTNVGTVLNATRYKIYENGLHSVDDIITVIIPLMPIPTNGKGYTDANDVDSPSQLADTDNDYAVETTDDYNIAYIYGTLTVNRRTVMVRTPSAQKEYDGTPLICTDGWEIVSDTVYPNPDDIAPPLETESDYYDWLLDDLDLSSTSLLENHTLKLDETKPYSSITNAGTIPNDVHYKVWFGDEDVSDNYEIAYVPGELTVIKRNVKVETQNGEWVYDAKLHSNASTYSEHVVIENGEPVADGEKTFVLDHFIAIDYLFEVINAGTYDNECSYLVKTASGDDVSSNYNLIIDPGTLIVYPRPIIITTHDGNRVYDDTPYSNISATPEPYNEEKERGLIDGHELRCDAFQKIASVTYVTEGKVENELHYLIFDSFKPVDDESYFVTDNYAIEYDYGEIFVTERPVTITTATSSKEFDGELYSDTGCAVTDGSLVDGHGLVVVDFAKVQFVTQGSVENKVDYRIEKDGADLTENYSIDYVYGFISRTVRYVKVKTATTNWTYDGELHSDTGNDAYHMVNLSFNDDGSVAYYETDGEKALVSEHELVPLKVTGVCDYTENAVINEVTYIVESPEITLNYYLHIEYGELSISKRPLTITTHDGHGVFNGEPFTNVSAEAEKFNKESKSGIVEGHEIAHDASRGTASVTFVTEEKVKNELYYLIYNSSDHTAENDVTVNYEISYVYGEIYVTARPIIITTEGSEKVYDGTPLEYEKFGWESCNAENTRGLLESEKYNHSVALDETKLTASITYITLDGINEIDSAPNERFYKIENSDGEDISDNYDIEYDYGTLTILKRSLTITTATLSWDYDGQWHYGENSDMWNRLATFDNLVSVNGAKELSLAGDIAKIIDYSTDGVKNDTQYQFVIPDDTTDTGYFHTTQCYDITYVYGTLTINKVALHITTITATKVYDGVVLRGDDETYGKPIFSTTIEGDMYRAAAVYLNNCGTKQNTTQYVFFAHRGETYVSTSNNYVISYTYGTLTITPREITIKTKTITHEYDGEEFTYPDEWEDIGELKLCDNHTLEVVEIKGKITSVGSVVNEVVYKVVLIDASHTGITNVHGNYIIKYDYGTLTVTPRNILITTASNSWVYDGAAHCDDRYEKVVHIDEKGEEDGKFALVDGHSLTPIEGTANSVVDYTPVKVTNVVKFTVKNFNDNYNITYTQGDLAGKLEITKRTVTITTATKSSVYNGQPFSWTKDYVVEEFNLANKSGIVTGHTAEIDTDFAPATVTYVHEGEVDNVIKFVIMSGGVDVTENYNLDGYYNYGKLSITPYEITVTNPNRTKPYDGTALSGDDIAIFDGKLFSGDYPVADKIAKIIDFGIVKNDTSYIIKNADGTVITDSYAINYTDGATLSITTVTLKVTTATLEKVYDGTPLYGAESLNDDAATETSSAVKIITPSNIVGLSENDTAEPDKKNTASRIAVCNGIENDTKYFVYAVRDGKRENVTDNYVIEYVKGTLTVTVREITIATASDEKDFDGTPLTNTDGAQVTSGSLAEGQELYLKDDAIVPSVTFVSDGEIDNEIEYSIRNADGDVTDNYKIRYYNMSTVKEYGTLKINPRRISLTSATNEWEYDGGKHIENGYVNLKYLGKDGGEALVSGHKLIAVSGTEIINAGSCDNVVEYIVENEEINKNYSIAYNGCGTLTITPRRLSIVLHTVGDTVYGEEFVGYPADNGFSYAVSSRPVAENEELHITVKYQLNGTDVNPVNAGRYQVVVASKTIVGGNANVDNYEIEVTESSFEISRREITINLLETNKKIYDGYAYEFPADNYEVVSDIKVIDGDTLKIAVKYLLNGVETSARNAGEYSIIFDEDNCTVNDDNGLANNYKITCINGDGRLKYTIDKRPISFGLKNLTHAYVGKVEYKFADTDAMEFDETQLADTDALSEVSAITQLDGKYVPAINVGVYDYVISYFVVVDATTGDSVSDNYQLVEPENTAKFTIIPREVYINVWFDETGSSSSSREYTGDIINLNEVFAPYGPYSSYSPAATETANWGIYQGDLNKISAVFSFTKGGSDAELEELGEYGVSVELKNKDGYDALKNYDIKSYSDGAFSVTKRQVNIIPETPSDKLEYDGEKLSEDYLKYYTRHNFSDSEGFLYDTDPDDYRADYFLYKDGDESKNHLNDILQAGDYYLKVKLTYTGSGEELYLINDDFATDSFSVAKRKIYANTPDDDTAYIYNKVEAATPAEYTAYYYDGEWTENAFVHGDEKFVTPVYTYYKEGQSYEKAINAGEYTIKIDAFNGINPDGNIPIADNYEIHYFDEIGGVTPKYGKLYIKPAILIVVPKEYTTQTYDGTTEILSLPSDYYEIKFVEDRDNAARTTLFGQNEVLSFTASGTVNIRRNYMSRVSFNSVTISEDGVDISSNYDIVYNYTALTEKCSEEIIGAFTRDQFSVMLAFRQMDLYIRQFAPPEKYKEIEYGTNEQIKLENPAVTGDDIENPEILLSGHSVVVSMARAVAIDMNPVEQWIYLCKVLDGNGEDISKAYNIIIDCVEESHIKVRQRELTISVNFAPSRYNNGDTVDSGDYVITEGSLVFGATIEISVNDGEFVADIKTRIGDDHNSRYNVKFVYPETTNLVKEAEYASRI